MPPRTLSPVRGQAAAAALLAVREELRDRISPNHPLAPRLYAGRIVENDDEHGGRAGLVVQGDGLRWQTIDGLLNMALYGMLMHRELAHAGQLRGPGCAVCEHAESMWQTTLLDPLLVHRGAADLDIYLTLRAIVRAEVANLRASD
ncbi:MAG: hypothetical protein ACR2N4_19620 [Jatrophihabitans sp.]